MENIIKQLYNVYKNHPSISTDSRKIIPGSIFFALKGDNFDGNQFAEEAIRKGAVLAVIDSPDYKKNEQYFLVDDSLKCLQNLARHHRMNLTTTKIIALTGSNGKTTTKELIKEVLGKKFKVVATDGNLNNHIGVPLTILSVTEDCDFAVIEMGANHLGEISFLSEIIKPNFGIITNIGLAHVGKFGTKENIIKAKNELYNFLEKNNGAVFVNITDLLLLNLSKNISRFTYGNSTEADCRVELKNIFPSLELIFKNKNIKTKIVGDFNFDNISAAIAAGSFFDVEASAIKEAVENYVPQNNRSQIIQRNSTSFFLDAYNANPSSVHLVLNFFFRAPFVRKIVILGDMNELGEYSLNEHIKILKEVSKSNIQKAFIVGQNFIDAKKCGDIHEKNFSFFNDTNDLISFLKENKDILKNSFTLVKGSRKMGMERILEFI